MIPTTSWDHIWHGVAQWVGVTTPADMDVVLPNRNNFVEGEMFGADELFGTPGPVRARERFLRY